MSACVIVLSSIGKLKDTHASGKEQVLFLYW